MRRLPLLLVLTLGWACAAPKKPIAVPRAPEPTPAERLAAADALVLAGCYDCLVDAYHRYDDLRQSPAVADAATTGAIRASALLALRERELGMVDGGYMKVARGLAPASGAPDTIGRTLDVLDALPGGLLAGGRSVTDDAFARSQRLRANRVAWRDALREAAGTDVLAAYAWTSLMCSSIEERDAQTGQIFATVAAADSPLMRFRRATCRGVQPEQLTALRASDPRFVEVAAFIGAFEVGQTKLEDADKHLQEAYDWHQKWPRVTLMIGNVAMTAEDFDRALDFYEKTIALEASADALIGKVRAQTYLGKAEEAIATTDQMLASQWYLGEARYWRALNEAQLNRLAVAWDDIELSDRLLINADVPKLAGIIAYRQQESDPALGAKLDVARVKFETSLERNTRFNSPDCETMFYLGVVLGDERQWERTVTVLGDTVRCIEGAEKAYLLEIDRIRTSDDPPARKERQIARREKAIANGRRMIATSWFNTAVAHLNLTHKDEARAFAEKVIEDQQFSARAREILDRLKY